MSRKQNFLSLACVLIPQIAKTLTYCTFLATLLPSVFTYVFWYCFRNFLVYLNSLIVSYIPTRRERERLVPSFVIPSL